MHGRSFLLAREEVTWFSIIRNQQVTNSTKHLKRQCNLNTRSLLNNRDDQWYESGSISSRKSFFALRSFPCLAFACLGFVRFVKSKSKMIRSFCFFCERDSVAAFILFLVSWIYDYFSSQNKKTFHQPNELLLLSSSLSQSRTFAVRRTLKNNSRSSVRSARRNSI